ncbi:MAG: acylphosphatase [Planctomycetes bacterium]|nr:acylphosphatase [Planctomycetota bacterium]NOG54092.1 acylphosphatase [Planctomycetota bacterium]
MAEQCKDDQVRCHARFQGRVQGVGFRMTTCSCAKPYWPDVTGWVRNEPDGSVSMVAEGPRGKLESLLADLQSRMQRNIHDAAVHWSEPSGEFTGFETRY